MTNNTKTISVSLYLHRDEIEKVEDCLKEDLDDYITEYKVIQEIGLKGKIFVHETVEKKPEWYTEISSISKELIDIKKSASNKAVVILEHRNRFFSISYGYGKSLLDESSIERNFGLITCVNLLDTEKIKSLNSMSIENIIVDTQKQSSSLSSQDKLQIDKTKDILKSVAGTPKNQNVGKFIVGTDSLTFTHKMNIIDIKDQIEYLYNAYKSNEYKENGFGWLDNIKRVKDSKFIEKLNNKMCEDLLSNINVISISPNRILDWEDITGFYISGMDNKSEHTFEIDATSYVQYIQRKKGRGLSYVLKKLKRDKLVAFLIDGEDENIDSIYNSLIYECFFDSKKFILTLGDWFEIDQDYYEQVTNIIDDIPRCTLQFAPHNLKSNEHESIYNRRITDHDENLALLDMVNFRLPEYGRSKIEPCDVISKNKQLIHVKKRGESADLSHLFAQAHVSARILTNEVRLKEHINKQVESKFGRNFLEQEMVNSEFEIVFAVITEKYFEQLSNYFPFFSMVNLRYTVEHLKAMNFKYSVMIIDSK